MREKSQNSGQVTGWNGVEMRLPITWEPRFPGKQHMVFEKNFIPQLQFRWEKVHKLNVKNLQMSLEQFSSDIEIVKEKAIPAEWSPLNKRFGLVLLAAQKGEGRITNGILGCDRTNIVFFFQVLDSNAAVSDESASALASLTCNNSGETFWQFQDFSFTTPCDFTLANYTFAAGLTRLSFERSNLICHICRLSPADKRLEQQSLDEILKTLVNEKDISLVRDHSSCSIWRDPPVWRQILYRLSRRKPFILAEIQHLEQKNILLASVLLSRQPISIDNSGFFNTRDEIIQKKSTK